MTNLPILRDLPRIMLAVLFITALIAASLWILSPFIPALIWAMLVVVSTWPLMLAVQKRLWGRRGLAVTVMMSALLLVVIVPLALAVTIIVNNADQMQVRVLALTHSITLGPPAWVEPLPLIGPQLAAKWQSVAALDAVELRAQVVPYASDAAHWLLTKAGGLAMFFLHLGLTAIISAILYSRGEEAASGVRAFASRLAGARGEQMIRLAEQTIRAVALGVVVTAAVQAAFGGIGLVAAGVPFPGLLTALMFVLAVAQIGAGPVLVLAVVWLYWTGQTWTATAFLVWALFVGSIDNVLRPLLIKRGANLPLVLVFAGAVGGLFAFGFVGIFIGPVVLAIAYTALTTWVKEEA